jgi:hypothetical protein
MPRTILLTLLFSLFFMTCGGPAYTQGPSEDAQEETPDSDTAPHEVPQKISTVMVEGNHLSVEFVDISFGEILQSISQKAGFKLEGSSPAFGKTVTTKFTDLGVDEGLVRLFSLVKESNYLISYDGKGSISKLQIPSARAGKMPQTPARRQSSSGAQISSGPGPSGDAPQQRSRFRFRRQRPGTIQQPGVTEPPQQVPQPEPPQPVEPEEAPDE